MRGKSCHRALLAAAVIPGASICWALPAFPGAQGYGANAQGGRGGDVYHVTTLADDPDHLIPGSLFYGLYDKNVPAAGRTIVFDVGGTIYLNQGSTLDIKNIKNVTIAGQTAPSPITIIGNTVQITSSSGKETGNIIMQYLTLRKGTGDGQDALSIKGSGNTHDIMIDHVSASWSEDEVISVGGATNHATNVTVQNSILSEALTNGHQYGSLVRNNQNANVSYLHNLYSNNASRNPRPGTYLGTQLNFEFQNNVIYNWSDRAGYTGGASESDTENVSMNYVGNYVIAGPSTVGGPTTAGAAPVTGAKRNTAFTKDASNDPLNLKIYQSGNLVDWSAGATRDGQDIGWAAFANWNGVVSSAFPAGDQMASPFAFATSSADSANEAYAKVISSVGAFSHARSATDIRLVDEVLNYTGTAAKTATPAAEWSALLSAPTVSRPAGWDTDADGMPNWWETARGFNATVADNNVVTADGYTRLEHYLQALTLIANWNANGGGSWSDYLNWRGTRPEVMDSTANFGNVLLAPATILVELPVSVGQLSFDSPYGYTLAGSGLVTLSTISGVAAVNVASGNHVIQAPAAFANDTVVTVAPASQLDFVGDVAATGNTVTKEGTGLAQFRRIRTNTLNVNAGVVRIAAGNSDGSSMVTSLTVLGGAQLDLSDNALVIDYSGASVLTGTVQMLQDGRLASSSTNALTTIGVVDNAQAGLSSFEGQSVDSTSVLAKFTFRGDANLDGAVDITDLAALASAWQASGTWWNGDFNYDGVVDITDLSALATNWQSGSAGPSLRAALASVGLGGVAVPEPSTVALVCIGVFVAMRRVRS